MYFSFSNFSPSRVLIIFPSTDAASEGCILASSEKMKLHAATGIGHRDAGHSGQEGAGHQRDIKQRILSLAVGPCCLQRRMGFWEYYSPIFGTFVSIFIGGRGIGVIQFRRAGGHITSVFDSDHESGVLGGGGVGSAGAYTSAGDVIICCHSPTSPFPPPTLLRRFPDRCT